MNSILMSLVVMIFVGYIVLYFGGRKYLEDFESGSTVSNAEAKKPVFLKPDNPYASSPILDVDDYEYSLVFQNEGSREASKKELNAAMSRYPLDWSVQPPSSQKFQQYKEAFLDASQKQEAPDTSMFHEIDGSNIAPPNMEKIDEEERAILQTYKPESSKGLLSYSLDDVKQLIDRVYTKKGLIPTVEKSQQGENIYEIVEVKKKDEPIIWEDDYEKMTEREKMALRGEEIIEVPQVVNDMNAGLDPFFQPRTSVRNSRHDYTQWTPGLERSFAPTYPIQNWY